MKKDAEKEDINNKTKKLWKTYGKELSPSLKKTS